MSKNLYNTPVEHSSDATFRSWGLALSTAIAAVITAGGFLQQTSDTGQINWATVTRPGVSTAAGYEIYKFTDTLSGSAPIYFKLEYGTGSSSTSPQLWITVGTGSNGSGTITGTGTIARSAALNNAAPSSTVNNFPTYVSSVDGFFGIAFKLGATVSGGMGMFGIGRPCNQDASLRSDAVVAYISSGTSNGATAMRFSDGVTFGSFSNHAYCMRTYGVTASTVSTQFQAWRHVCAYPQTFGFSFFGTVLNSELSINTSDTATFYGSTARTYVCLGSAVGPFSVANVSGDAPFMIWET